MMTQEQIQALQELLRRPLMQSEAAADAVDTRPVYREPSTLDVVRGFITPGKQADDLGRVEQVRGEYGWEDASPEVLAQIAQILRKPGQAGQDGWVKTQTGITPPTASIEEFLKDMYGMGRRFISADAAYDVSREK